MVARRISEKKLAAKIDILAVKNAQIWFLCIQNSYQEPKMHIIIQKAQTFIFQMLKSPYLYTLRLIFGRRSEKCAFFRFLKTKTGKKNSVSTP